MPADLPLSSEQIAVVREVFGDDISHLSDAHVSLAVSQSTFEHLADGSITPEHVVGAMAHLNESQGISYGEMRLLDTAEALASAMSDVQSGANHGVEIVLQGELIDYKQGIDSASLVGAVEQHLEVMQDFNQSIGTVREALGDAVADMSDTQLAESLGPQGMDAIVQGKVDLSDALTAQAEIGRQLGVGPEQVDLAEAVSTLVRAQEDLADAQPFNMVHVSVQMESADGLGNQVSQLVDSAELVGAVQERGEAQAEASTEAAPSHEAEADAGMSM